MNKNSPNFCCEPSVPATVAPDDTKRLADIRTELDWTADRLSRLVGALRDASGDLSRGPNIVTQEELDRRELTALRLLFKIENDDHPDVLTPTATF